MTTELNARVGEVTARIVGRSRAARGAYLGRIEAAVAKRPARKRLGCANFAHGFAACGAGDKAALRDGTGPNLAIVTAYNDMLSAHQPFARFPDLIKRRRARGRRLGPGRRRRSSHVRRGHAGRKGHGPVAVLTRRDRALDRRRAVARHVRRGGLSRRLRQDRAGSPHRRALLRPFAGGVPAGRSDAIRPRQ